MANKVAIRKLITRLKRIKPKNYEQADYFYGSAACLAGHTCLINGWKPVKNDEWLVSKGTKIKAMCEVAKSILRLSASSCLFDSDAIGWTYQDEFRVARTNIQRVGVAIKELETYL
jgi:hypothetical protein